MMRASMFHPFFNPPFFLSVQWLRSSALQTALHLCCKGPFPCRSSRAVNCHPCSSSPPFLKGTALRQVDMPQLFRSCPAVIESDCRKLEIKFILSGCPLYTDANNDHVTVTATGRQAGATPQFEGI